MPTDRSPFTLRAALHRQAVLATALPLLAVAVAVGVVGHAPLAGALLAAVLLGLAGARLVLPTRTMGALAVRSRGVDVTVMTVLGLALAVLSGSPNL